MIMAGRSYRRTGDKMSRSILTAAILLVLVQVAYFAYYAAGITSALWDDGAGFYFSANDVLHVGMIAWLGYVAAALGGSLKDLEPNPQGGAKGQLVGGGGG
jgi:hypothetical protein